MYGMEKGKLDLLIVGAGLTGLITARDCAHGGVKVKVLESRDRPGGQIWSINHPDTGLLISLGGEWLNLDKQERIAKEFIRYGIPLDNHKFHSQYMLHSWNGVKSKVGGYEEMISTIKSDPLFEVATDILSRDIYFLSPEKGFDQCLPHSEEYDMSFEEYLQHRLKLPVNSVVYEFFEIQVFHLTGGAISNQSALAVLLIIAWFGSVERAFSMAAPALRRYGNSLSLLIDKLIEDIESSGGSIDYNRPVTAVIKEPDTPTKPRRVPIYDRPPQPRVQRSATVKCENNMEYTARSVIIATPVKCIKSIRFLPEIPDIINASERCNAGHDLVKLYTCGTNVSHTMDRMMSRDYACRDSYLVSRYHHRHHVAEPENTGGVEAEIGQSMGGDGSRKKAAGRDYLEPSPATSSRRDDKTLICTVGNKHLILPDSLQEQHLRQLNYPNPVQDDKQKRKDNQLKSHFRRLYPVMEFSASSNTRTRSRPGSNVSTTTGGSSKMRTSVGANSSSSGSRPETSSAATKALESAGTAERMPHIAPATASESSEGIIPQQQKQKEEEEGEEEPLAVSVPISVPESYVSWYRRIPTYNTLQQGAVLYHDFFADTHTRTSWFVLRKGTAELHTLTRRAADHPWGLEDLSLLIASSEFAPQWTGWIEGAVMAGQLAAQRMIPYLIPPIIPRNFARRVPVPVAVDASLMEQQPTAASLDDSSVESDTSRRKKGKSGKKLRRRRKSIDKANTPTTTNSTSTAAATTAGRSSSKDSMPLVPNNDIADSMSTRGGK